jgi:hypothetical protein
MTEEDVAEYVEKMKDKPRKQIHHKHYKEHHSLFGILFDPVIDVPLMGFGILIIICYILAILGLI